MYATLSKAPELRYALILPVLTWLVSLCMLWEAADPGAAVTSLALTAVSLPTAFLLWPMLWRTSGPGLRDLARWLPLTLTTCAPLLLVVPFAGWPALVVPLLAGLLVLCLFVGALTLSLARLLPIGIHGAHRAVACLLLLAMAAPLWLGPLAGRLANASFTDLVVAISPTSYLAGLIGIDLYRTAWFYAHTPLGGLRYEDPDIAVMTLFYCASAALLLAVGGVLTRHRHRRSAGIAYHSLHEEPTT